MAVQARLEADMIDYMDDDDQPLISKRISTTSKYNRKASLVKSPLSISHKLSSSAEPSKHLGTEKPIVSKQNKVAKKATASPNAEDSEDEKPLIVRLSKGNIIAGKELKNSSKSTSDEANSAAEGSEDKKPLLAKLSKGNMIVGKEVKSKGISKANNDAEGFEDEKSRCARLSKEKMIVDKEVKKSIEGTSGANNAAKDSEDKKPILARLSKGKMIVGKKVRNSSKGTSKANNDVEGSEDEKSLCAILSKEKMIFDKEKNATKKNDVESNYASEDSEDETPIYGRLTAASSNGHSSKGNSEANNDAKGSEDEKSLCARLSKEKTMFDKEKNYTKKNNTESNNALEDSEDETPIYGRLTAASSNGNSSKGTSEASNDAEGSEDEKSLCAILSKEKMIFDKEKNATKKNDVESNYASEDSEDETPIYGRLTAASSNGHSSKGNSEANNDAKGSEDEKSLCARLSKEKTMFDKEKNSTKKNNTESNNALEDSEDETPIYGRLTAASSNGNSSKGTSEANNDAEGSEDEKSLCAILSKEKMIFDKEKNATKKNDVESNYASEDSEDETPIYGRLTAASSNGHSSKGNSEANNDAKGSEDEKSLCARLSKEKTMFDKEKNSTKKNNTEPNNALEDSEDETPIYGRLTAASSNGNSSKGTSEANNDAEGSEDEKSLCARLSKEKMILGKEKKATKKNDAESNKVSEDSEDETPIRYRLTAASSNGNNLNHAKQGVSSSSPVSSSSRKSKINVKKSYEESDDDMPLSAKISLKSDGMTLGVKSNGNRNNPLYSKLQQNGSASKDGKRKSSTLLYKSLLDKVNSSSQSSSKKLKLSDASPSLKNKPPSIESDTEGSEDTPASKSSTGSLKVNKVTTFKKRTIKTIRVETKSKYSQYIRTSPKSRDRKKWTTLVHNGFKFPPPYKPHGVKMLYKGKPIDLTPEQEEVATMFAAMMDDDKFARKEVFITNFMNDWRKILGKKHIIQKFEDCDFRPIYEWDQREKEREKEKRKLMSTEEKKALLQEKLSLDEKYKWATVDGVKEEVGNFAVELPGLFTGHGENPKMGKVKRRIRPSDVTINIGKGAPVPECPIPGESWKNVKHDNTVTWLAFWTDTINNKIKYIYLGASSSSKGQGDKEKYEKARTLKAYIQGIRLSYTQDFVSKDTTKQQIAVATYLIDKLAIRAGNEKGEDEVDTVGCCTLKVENVKLIPPNKLEFDFLGKDSVRYNNVVEVELAAYKAIAKFQKGKREGDELFENLDTSKLNAHLKDFMPELTAKVFRTYNASITFDEMLARNTKGGDVAEKIAVLNRANKEVALICNHQRSISKSHASQISNLDEKMDKLKDIMEELNTDLARALKGKSPSKDEDGKQKKNLTFETSHHHDKIMKQPCY